LLQTLEGFDRWITAALANLTSPWWIYPVSHPTA
jgi:hypothetical protein